MRPWGPWVAVPGGPDTASGEENNPHNLTSVRRNGGSGCARRPQRATRALLAAVFDCVPAFFGATVVQSLGDVWDSARLMP